MSDTKWFTPTFKRLSESQRPNTHAVVTEALMRDAAAKGISLEQLSSPKIMDRSMRTLKMRARQFDLVFIDYTPRKLKPKKERKKRDRTRQADHLGMPATGD